MKRLIIFALFSAIIYSNITYSQPKLTLHLTGGYSLPLPDLRGDIPLKEGDNNYQVKNGFNFGADGKFALDKKCYIKITASLAYNMFNNSGDMELVENGIETRKINIFSTGLGFEYSFFPKKNINPFIGAEFTGNFFNGKHTIEIGDTSINENTLKSESRFGININGGIDIVSSKNIGIVIGIKYNIANLFGKDSASVSGAGFALWDKEYIYNGRTISAKNIQYIQFYAGLSFYLIQPKKKINK